jgi:hypothetical protein
MFDNSGFVFYSVLFSNRNVRKITFLPLLVYNYMYIFG